MRWLLILALLARSAPAAPSARCVFDRVAAPKPAQIAAPACHQPPADTAAAIRAAIVKRYLPTHGGKPQVTFACDGLGPSIREIVIETGEGHGGTLALWRARRGPGTRYDVRGIVYRGASMVRPANPTPFELAAGSVELPGLERVRAALAATVSEVVPPLPPGTIRGMSMSSSSRDFHILVRLTDDDGRVLERSFTGYVGSLDQDRYLGPEIAGEALGRITALSPAAGAATADDQRLFAERFAAAAAHFDDDFYWWVMERHVDLARYLGTPATIPGLLTRLVVTKPDRSKIDARANALDALARITGWDARTGSTVEEAAAHYLVECKPR